MSEPQPSGAAAPPPVAPGWAPPATEWVAEVPTWTPATAWAQPAAAPAPQPAGGRGESRVVAALVAAAVLAAGVLVSALVAALVLAGRAEDLGRGIGSGLGAELGQAVDEQVGGLLGPEGWSADPPGPAEQSEPVPPGTLGTDPALDGYARDCFAGDLDACDRLYLESAPFSEYERYGSTCGGRVKPYAVALCTELE
ncbi:hypothetical protein DQ238_10450 [Geodermatophilus sp. TF02-6]|uniref:hypothetical protein n=1 Tax=Geodermatophilus sp. TF02-6 TaxID=2250575 RepID=UPI000DEAEEA9|nr:hypothetical protein [Geodermatophilus sp. TF02-6]RBY79600.1 hypothetical protein DQ238_10450 [Geodermatophilus sp. TF02-6]